MRVIILALLATGALAAPFSLRKEKPQSCDKRSSRFHHAKEFPYTYEGESVSTVAGASSARSGLKIRARCIIKAVAPCQHVLRIDTVELWEAQSKNPGPLEYTKSRGSAAFAEELQAHDLVFRMDRGRVTQVLSHLEEPSHVLNIKRGILSAMQVQFVNEHAVVEEEDVVGTCKSQYHIKSRHLNGRPKVVYKSRNLTDCIDRAKTDLGIHVHSYNEKPVSLLKSESTCKLVLLAKKSTQRIVCEEKHIFRPFSAGYQNASGAITTVRQVLELQKMQKAEPVKVAVEEMKLVSLKYEHSEPQSNEEAVNEAFLSVFRLSRESQKETKSDSAQHFSKLVFGIRKLNSDAMQTLWQKVHNEDDEKLRTYLYDALPHCGTGGCAKVMSQAVRNNLVSNERGNMFLAGLAMAGNPTEDTIEHVLELCESSGGRTAMLTLGTLLHKFCESNSDKCSDEGPESAITRADNFLRYRLGEKCDAETPEELESILITLKAIGNAGRPVKAEKALFKCALNPSVPMNMSIAAIEALRRMPCSSVPTSQLLDIYGEYTVDVELRIASYLALLKCPSPEVFTQITSILKSEVNNQVGSFVWSHMTNAMESTEPVHGQPLAEMIKEGLGDMKLREFNLNRLRFSRAWEGSFYSDILRFGGSAQSHLIYHPSSFFPRSALVNITVDVLGASINVLEAAARFEGFEILIEQFFGEDGMYPDERIMKMFNLKPHEERDKVEKLIKGYMRRRRSINEDINRVESHLNKLHQTMDTRKHHPSGAVSVKVFGNEMRLASFDDISWLNDEVDNINMVDILLKLAQGGKKTYTKSMMFLDAETTLPTIIGLPLKLSAKGTTVSSVELSGKFDIRNMFWGKMSFDVRGYVRPSAVVDISGRMGVSAVFAEAGILVNSSLYTTTQIKGNATYMQGETLKFEVGVPEDPVQFVNVSSSLFVTLNDKEIPIEGTPRRIEPSPCLNMTRVLGVTFCSQMSLPLGYRDYESPFFPFSGPASFSVSMKRTDPKLTKYQLIAERLETEDENKYDIVAKLSTPGATWERNFEANSTLWLQADGKLFQLSTGALGYNFGKFEATYNNISHALNLTYSAKDAIYRHPIVLNGHFFNNTRTLAKEFGFQLSATYKNYTIRHMAMVYNRSHVYGYVSNVTYWPHKYFYSAGELSIPDRSISFVANHTCSKTEVRMNGKLGEEEDNFVLSFTNKPTQLGLDVTGRILKDQKEGVLRVYARPSQQSFSLRGSYLKTEDEKGIRFTASHDNTNRVLNWYAGIVNSTDEKSLKANATILGRKAEAAWSYFNFSQEKGIKFNGLLLNRTMDAVWSYVHTGSQKGLKLNATVLNKTMEAAWTFFNYSDGKSVKFNSSFVNKSVEAVWSYFNLRNERGLKFDLSAMNKTANAVWSYVNFGKEKGMKVNASVMNKTLEAIWSYFNLTNEKGLKFNVSAMNKTVEAVWSYVNFGNDKQLKFNTSAMNKTLEAVWSYFNLTNEKGLKLNVSAMNKSAVALWSYVDVGQEKGFKFNASVMNKTLEAIWSYFNFTSEKGVKLNVSAMNRTAEAVWSYFKFEKEMGLKFNAKVLNRSIETALALLNHSNERSIRFNASALNNTLVAMWSYVSLEKEKALRFNASGMNQTVEATWSYFNINKERGIRFNASALNKTIEAAWTFAHLTNAKSLQFKVRALNQTLMSAWTYVALPNTKSIKFNASLSNKTVEASWSFVDLPREKLVKFNAKALNISADAVWSYLKGEKEKSIKFYASTMNRSVESVLTFFNLTDEKGIKFNMVVMKKTMNASLFYFKHLTDSGLRLNLTFCNKSVQLVSKFLSGEKEKKLLVSASYQNYTVALTGLLQNLATQKSACLYPQYLGRTHGKICLVFTNSSTEKSMALNMTVLNRTGELKSQLFMTPNICANHLTAKSNSTTFFESWISTYHKPELKALDVNMTLFNKSAGATLYFQNEAEKVVGLNVTYLDKAMGIKGVWLNEKTFKEAAVFLVWNKINIATSSVKLVNYRNRNMLEFRGRIGRYVAELQNVYTTEKEGRTEFIVVRMLRNGSQSLFFDSSNLIYTRMEKSRNLAYYYKLKVVGRTFNYGWDVSYNNFSTTDECHYETKLAVMYSKGKSVSLTTTYRNTLYELSATAVVEYLPEKTMTHSLTWYKQRNTVDLKWEILPRMPVTWKIFWSKYEGFSINSVFTTFNKNIENWFKFSSITGEYNGHFEIWPAYPLTVKGTFSKEYGLVFTTAIGFVEKTWSHKIEFNKEEGTLFISAELFPQSPVTFEASWNVEEGLQITTDFKAFKKSLHWQGAYDKLTKTFTSNLTLLKQKVFFMERVDMETKTLILSLAAFDRTFGFTGRFDWRNYVVSSFASYQKHTTGWFLRFNPSSRSVVFNASLTPTISGQIVGEMPDGSRLQVTLQRKFGISVVNESRLMYHLKPEASRVSLTWNTATTKIFIKKVEFIKTLLKNFTERYYNLTAQNAKNLTMKVETMIEKLQEEIRPQIMKLYGQVRNFDYKGLMENATKLAKNMTYQAYNVTLKILNSTVDSLPILLRNATELFRQIRQNATGAYKRFRSEMLPPIVGNVTVHVKNITRDLKLWASNVSVMISGVTVRGQKIGDVVKRVTFKVNEMTMELLQSLDSKSRELIVKIRGIEIRKQKLGPLFDEYMLQVWHFTCGFNATCTMQNLTSAARNATVRVLNMTVLNKTVEQHFIQLKNKTFHFHKKALLLARNLTVALPKFLRNTSIQAIHFIRNVTREVKIITLKTVKITSRAYSKIMSTHRPLVNLVTNVAISVKRRTAPVVIKIFRPMVNFARELKDNISVYVKPVVQPLIPMAFDMVYQVRNITIRRMPIGQCIDKAVNVTIFTVAEAFKSVNHGLSSNISAAIAFIRENSQKTPEEIVDLTIEKSIQLFNMSRKAYNQSVELGLNLTRRAALAFNMTIDVLNKTLSKVLQMRPKEIVEISIQKVKIISRNFTAEVLNITKQLRAMDFARPVKTAWTQMDLKGKLEALNLKAKWESLIQRIRAFDIKQRALGIRHRISSATEKFLEDVRDITELAQRALNLINRLIRMQIHKEDFVDEVIAIGKEGKSVLVKYGLSAKKTGLGVHQKLRNLTLELVGRYKNMSVDKTLELYGFLKRHALSFYDEHRKEGVVVYDLYKAMIMRIYEDIKDKVTTKVDAIRGKLMEEMEKLVAKARQFENTTYEEIVMKGYELTSNYGLALYKNITVRSMKLFNETRNATLRAYNFTLVLANRTKLMVHQYYKTAHNFTLHYYNVTQKLSLQYYNLTRNFTLTFSNLTRMYTLKYYKQYYNLTRNYTLNVYNMTRNVTLNVYNMTRALVLRGIRYANETLVPFAKDYVTKGKALILGYANKTVVFVEDGTRAVKVWYQENKEKTVEELYYEAYMLAERKYEEVYGLTERKYNEMYGLAERKYSETKELVKAKLDEVKGKLKITLEQWKKELQKFNKTVMNITGEIFSVYNQTLNITSVATKDLATIFSPYVKIIHNRTVFYLVKAKNASLPLLQMARNTTLETLGEARRFFNQTYEKFMARKEVQEFIEKHQLRERVANFKLSVMEKYNKAVHFVKETKPKVEAKLREIIFYVNVTLPGQMKEHYTLLRQKYQRLRANPQAFIDRLSKKAMKRMKKVFKNTPVEEIYAHEIWSDFLEEAQKHELLEVGWDAVDFTVDRLKNASRKVSLMIEEAKPKMMEIVKKVKSKVQEARQKVVDKVKEIRRMMMSKFKEFKGVKLREIVEHNYVFKTIDLAKNVTFKLKNITVEVRNLTLRLLAMKEAYFKNFTVKVQNYTLILKKEYNRLYKKHVIPLYKNCTMLFQKYRQMAKHYVVLGRNMTLKGMNITRNWTVTRLNMTRMWINKTMERGLKYYREEVVPLYHDKVLPLYYKEVLPYYTEKLVPMYQNYTSLVKELKANFTDLAMEMGQRAISLMKHGINLTLTSKPYAVLRKFGKMTIRESVLEGRAMCFRACNFTLNLTRLAVNMTLEKFNNTKAYLTRMMNVTILKSVPMVELMNATRAEIMETAKFVNKYYGIENAVRQRVRRSLDMTRNLTTNFTKRVIDHHAPRFLRTSAMKSLEFVNNTIHFINRTVGYMSVKVQHAVVYVNGTIQRGIAYANETIQRSIVYVKGPIKRTIVYVNETIQRTVKFVNVTIQNVTRTLNNTIHKARIAINKTIYEIRVAIPKYIQVKDGSVTIVIPHPRMVKGNITMLAYESVEMVKDLKRQALEKVEDLKLKAVEKVKELKQQALEKSKELKRQALEKAKDLKRQAQKQIKELRRQVVKKVKVMKRRALEKIDELKLLTTAKIENWKQQARNLTHRVRRLSEAWVAVAQNKTLLYSQKASKFVTKFYGIAKKHPVAGRYINVTLHYIHITKDFVRELNLTQMKNVTAKYLSTVLNMTHYSYLMAKRHPVAGKYINVTIKYLNITKDFVRGLNLTQVKNLTAKYFSTVLNMTSRSYMMATKHPVAGKYINVTIYYFNITRDFVRGLNLTQVKNVTTKYLSTVLNMTRRSYLMAKQHPVGGRYINLTIHYLNITRDYIRGLNLTQTKAAKYLFTAINMTRRSYLIAVNATQNLTLQAYKIVVNVTLDIYNSSCLLEAFGKSRNYSKIAFNGTLKLYQELYNKTFVMKKYLPIAVNMSRHWYGVGVNATRNFTLQVYRKLYNTTLLKTYLPVALNMSRQWYGIGLNTTRNFTLRVYKVAVNVTSDIYNSSCLLEAFGKSKNYSRIAFNETLKLYRALYNKTLVMRKKYLPIALNMSRHWYGVGVNATRNFTLQVYRKLYNTTLIKKYLPMALNLSRQWYGIGLNATRNLTLQVYKVFVNVTLDIYNSSCMLEAFGKSKNYSKMAFNETLKLYQELYNKTLVMRKKYLPIALNMSRHWYGVGVNATRNFTLQVYRKVYNTTLFKKYLPMALNMSRQWYRIGLNTTFQVYKVAVNVTLDIYNSSCLLEAFGKGRNYCMLALNGTVRLCSQLHNVTLKKYLPIALNLSRQWYSLGLNATRNVTVLVYRELSNKTLFKKYLPMALNVSRQWYNFGFNTTRNFTMQAYKVAVNVTLDIYNSSCPFEALEKLTNYSRKAFNEIMKLYHGLRKKALVRYGELSNVTKEKYAKLYNLTLEKYTEIYNRALELYRRIVEHETTVRYMNHARNYLDHSKKMMTMRARHLQSVKRYWQKRVSHKVSQISRFVNPVNWIPPFNSTAMIFGGPHVYTFDKTYYTFPGYKRSDCIYVLARDVRDNKFTILSQETAIIVITEDSSVKIHQDGKVESIIKITTSGKKISDGFDAELPVQSANTTVTRDGSFIVYRHDLGLEILCDVEHYLCSFNFAKWYHGRMAGLLGTNNNEFHDEMTTSSNQLTKSLLDFVNSWEVTRDPECRLTSLNQEKVECPETSYIQRCRTLFKDRDSPLDRYASIVDPEPFVKACELDYQDCMSETPKDMKHCNTTAAFVELVRLEGGWAEHLPECARCGNNKIGHRWFQKAGKMVDVVVIVHETSVLKSYAEKLPSFLTSLTDAFEKYSFRFGLVGYGGRFLHGSPHTVTISGQLMDDLENLDRGIEHLKFTGEPSDNETTSALEALQFAARTYSFRAGATKIFLLLNSVEREVDSASRDRVARLLDASDITLNIIGKYDRFRGSVLGQDYRGKVYYRKKPELGTGTAALPEGEYVALMKSTQGSVFGLPFLGSNKKSRFGALQQATVTTWREQIKRDQYTCKECFCARGDAGQGKAVCKNNSFHKKC